VDGLTFLNAPNVTVVGVQTTRAVMSEEAKGAAPAAKGAATKAAPTKAAPAKK
jgi:hypothetical protein